MTQPANPDQHPLAEAADDYALIEETNDFLDDSSAGADFGRVEVKADDFLPTAKEVEDEKKFDDIIGRH